MPMKDQARIIGFSAHCIVACAIGIAGDKGEFRYDGICYGIDHLGSVFDNSAMLTPGSYHKTRNILEKDERYEFLIAIHDKPRCLVCRIGVYHSSDLHLAGSVPDDFSLIGNNTDSPSIDPGIRSDDRLSIIGFILI